jgi:hypothetical protein
MAAEWLVSVTHLYCSPPSKFRHSLAGAKSFELRGSKGKLSCRPPNRQPLSKFVLSFCPPLQRLTLHDDAHQRLHRDQFPTRHMDSSLHEVWQAAAGSPFVPTVGKDNQFLVAIVLLLLGFSLGGRFALSRFSLHSHVHKAIHSLTLRNADRSVVNLPVLAVPASLASAYVHHSQHILLSRTPLMEHQVRCGVHVLWGWSLRLRYPRALAESVP